MYQFEDLQSGVQSGGPPKDGIPSIDDPKFIDAGNADDELAPGDIVFGYAGEKDVKAYPQSILVWHEITNDVIDGTPVSVSYCPLTGTVLGFERGETEFGVSGNLLNNNLVMYDRETDSRWPQILGSAISGDFQGQSLNEFRLVWTTWDMWKQQHPDTQVLSSDTGFARNYSRDPYGQYNPKGGYYTRDGTLFPPLRDDNRYQAKRIVMGARIPNGALAFIKDSIREQKIMDGELDGTSFTAVYDPRFDSAYIYRNQDGVSLTFEDGDITVDGEVFSPDAAPLQSIHTFDAMWFAWSGFYPETKVFE